MTAMHRNPILAAIVALALAGAFIYYYGGSSVPAGQAPLERLTPQNLTDIRNAFNAAQGDVRLLVLLSPT